MGAGNFNLKEYKLQAKEAKVTVNKGFTAQSMCDEFNPANVDVRYSKRGPFNQFRDVITVLVGLDVTGSMGEIPKSLLTGKLGNLMLDLKEEFDQPNENLQISFAGIGDAKTDEAPLQVTHFESDNRFAKQLPKIWLESHGGANGAESYNLLWWYAANKTHLNYVEQTGRKGILITTGDDNVHPSLTAGEIQMWLDPEYKGGDISNEVLLNAVREQYHVYHISVTDGQAYKYDHIKRAGKSRKQNKAEAQKWRDLLGRENLFLTVADDVPDVIAAIVKRHRPNHGITIATQEEWKDETLNNLTDEQWREVLTYTLCPISRTYMKNPVVWGSNKRACEKKAVISYMKNSGKDPFTNLHLGKQPRLKQNMNIAQLCLDYKPYFDVLSEERRDYLIALTIPLSDSVEENGATYNQAPSSTLFTVVVSADSRQGQNANRALEDNLVCPITQEVMFDPVILVETGHTFERRAITEWFQSHNTNPLTGEELADKTLVPNLAVKSLCDDFRANNLQQSASPMN